MSEDRKKSLSCLISQETFLKEKRRIIERKQKKKKQKFSKKNMKLCSEVGRFNTNRTTNQDIDRGRLGKSTFSKDKLGCFAIKETKEDIASFISES